MAPTKRAKGVPSIPPPVPRTVSGTRAAVKLPPHPKVTAGEFLADEFVLDEAEEFVPDEDVVYEGANGSAVGFAGPSDPPPLHRPSVLPIAVPPTPEAEGQPLRIRWIVAVAAGVFLGVTARMLASSSPQAASVATAPVPPAGDPAAAVATSHPAAPAPLAPAAAPPAVGDPAPAAASASAPGATPDEAVDAKRGAQRALDHGKASLAVQLGERSVELDPTDADAWLVLGAAYLQRGAFKDARRCFSSCAKEATHGARGECAALLR